MWNVEYARVLRWPSAWVATISATLLAWPLWRRLTLTMPWRPRRLVAFVVSLLLLFVIVPWLGNAAMAVRFWWLHRDASDIDVLAADPLLPPQTLPPGTMRGPGLAALLVDALFRPLASSSLATVVVDGRELPFPAPRELTLGRWQGSTHDVRTTAVGCRWVRGWTWGRPTWIIMGVTRPGAPAGVAQPVWWTQPSYLGLRPMDFTSLCEALYPRRMRALVPILVVQVLAMGAIFLALPSTRRRYRVRWEHVVRIALYSMVWPILAMALLMPGSAYLQLLGAIEGPPFISSRMFAWTSVLMALLLTAWWAVAIRLYLRIPHALATAALAALGGWLIVAISFHEKVIISWWV